MPFLVLLLEDNINSGATYPAICCAQHIAGYEGLYHPTRKPGPITEIACWAHCRRKYFDVWETTKTPIAKEALDRIAAFYVIEEQARFAPAGERVEHRSETAPLIAAFFDWAGASLAKISAKSVLAEAFRYTITRRTALNRFLTDGRLEIDNNIAENGMRCIATGVSLCSTFSSIWKHWNCISLGSAIRATLSGGRTFNWLRRQIIGSDLVRRPPGRLAQQKERRFL